MTMQTESGETLRTGVHRPQAGSTHGLHNSPDSLNHHLPNTDRHPCPNHRTPSAGCCLFANDRAPQRLTTAHYPKPTIRSHAAMKSDSA